MPYIGQRPATGEHNSFKILDDISNYTLTFGSSDIDVSADTITAREHRFVTGQRVTYGNGGGTDPTGLSNGTVYYIIVEDRHTFKLATSASNAVAGTAINITAAGAGAAHTINVAFDGVNTKFKATHTNGTKADISQSGQLMVSVNGVLQQPHDNTTTPSTGYATDHTSTIIFSAAPAAGDQFFGRLIASNFATFDISDNTVDNFTGDGSTSTFTLSKTPPNNESILVTIDGVVQYPDDNAAVRAYTVSENVLDFASAPGNAVEIQVRHIGFAGASTAAVSGFYGRTGNAALKSTDNIVFNNATAGIVTATNITVTGNLTVDGTTTTLDTDLIGVDKLEVSANNTTVAAAITQTGSGDILNLYDGSTEVFTVTDGGDVGIVDKIIHVDDTNTAIRFPANDTFTVETSGSERLRITSDGEVTINNSDSDPSVLNLKGGGSSVLNGDEFAQVKFFTQDVNVSGSDRQCARISSIAENDHGSSEDARTAIGFYTRRDESQSPVERLRITHAGLVGIGTDNPSRILHVSSSNDQYIRVTSTNSANAGIEFGDSADKGKANIVYANSDDSMFFTVNGSEKVRVTSGGNVGINTNNPQTHLHVFDGASTGRILIQGGGSSSAQLQLIGGGQTNPFVITQDSSRNLIFYDHATERLRIDSSGNVTLGYAGNSLYFQNGFNNSASRIQNGGASNSANLKFYVRDSGTESEHMRLTEQGGLSICRDGSLNTTAGNETIYIQGEGHNGHGTGNTRSVVSIIGAISSNNAGMGIWIGARTNENTAVIGTRTASGNLAIETYNGGWGERLRITSAGVVGINKISPSSHAQLDVVGSSYWPILVKTTSTSGGGIAIKNRDDITSLYTGSGGSSWLTGSAITDGLIRAQNTLLFATNGNYERVRITSAGNVGINTTVPQSRLEVFTDNDTDFGNITNTNNTNSLIRLFNKNGTDNGAVNNYVGIRFDVANGATSSAWLSYLRTGNNTGAFQFKARNASSSYPELMRIRSDGKVGIGTNNPLVKTHVVGPSSGGGKLFIDTIGTFSGTDTSTLGFSVFRGGSNVRSNSQAEIECVGDGNYSGSLVFKIQNPGTYPNSLVERLRITSGGFVNIGGNYTQTSYTAQVTRIGGNTDVMQIKGSVGNSFIRFTDNDASSDFTLGADDAVGSNGFVLYDRNDSAYRLVVDTNGNLGIGVNNPEARLHVEENLSHSSTYYLNSDAHILVDNPGSGKSVLKLEGHAALVYGGGTYSFIVSDRQYERLRINEYGNTIFQGQAGGVSNGNTGNAAILVRGKSVSGSSTTVDLNISQATSASGVGLEIQESTNSANALATLVFNHGSLKSMIASSRVVTNQWGTDLRFYTHPPDTSSVNQHKVYERMRITSDGSVGIGEDNPTEKLHVSGTVQATAFRGSGNVSGLVTLGASSGNTTVDTGISVNASNGGGAMMVLASRNTSDQTNTAAGMYLLDFRYNGNHVPGVTFIGGDNICTFGKSGSNNLTVNCGSGNWSVGGFFGGYGIGNQL